MAAAPSTAMIMQRIDDIVTRLDRITESLEQGYVRKDVYAADRSADAFQIKGFEDELRVVGKRVDAWEDRASRAATARWTWIASSLLGPVLVVVLLRALGLVGG